MNEIRISLQDKLNKQVDSYVGAASVNDWAKALDTIASFENLYVIVTVVELVTGKEILPGTPNDIYEIIDAIRDFDVSEFLAGGLAEGSQIWTILADYFNPLSPGFEGDEDYFDQGDRRERTGYRRTSESTPQGSILRYWYYDKEITKEEWELGVQ